MENEYKQERLSCATREDWLAARFVGIGGSEAASAIGKNPWQTPAELWELKTGRREPKDLSDNPAVAQGVRMEPALRTMYAALHPEYRVEHYPYDIIYQPNRRWLFATLDGELIETRNGRRGILEIKTATPNGKAGWSEWSDGKMKPAYFIQTLHQLLATGYDFVRLFAALYSMNGDITLREYEIERTDHLDDLDWLLQKEADFWRYVENDTNTPPPAPLVL